MTDHTILAESNGYALIGLDRDPKLATVVRIDRERGQVYDAMPGDAPTDGGSWFARITDRGIRYVSTYYSRSYAMRVFRRLSVDPAAPEVG